MANYTSPTWENNQGPKLNAENLQLLTDKVEESQVLVGNGPPTGATAAAVGQRYADESSDPVTIYVCTANSGGTYTWEPVTTRGEFEQTAEQAAEGESYALAAFPTDTASGAVASFPDGSAGAPLKSLTVYIVASQEGSGDPGPSNIRPISGFDGATVTRVGKNLYPPYTEAYTSNNVTMTPNGDGSFTLSGSAASGTFLRTKDLPFPLQGLKFSFSLNNDVVNNEVGLRVRGPSTSLFGSLVTANVVGRVREGMEQTSFVPTGAQVVVASNHGDVPAITMKPQLELGEKATEWAAYTEETATISWAGIAGTVYGGELDLTAGTLTVTHGYIASYAGETLPGEWISDRDVYAEGTNPTTGAQVVYVLASPVTYPVQTATLHTVLGVNNIAADCGTVNVSYRADATLYIEKRLTALSANFAAVEPGATASRGYSAGDFLVFGGVLYKVSAAIEAGDELVPETNITAATVGGELTELEA